MLRLVITANEKPKILLKYSDNVPFQAQPLVVKKSSGEDTTSKSNKVKSDTGIIKETSGNPIIKKGSVSDSTKIGKV